jgi:AhpD family alkylhydroperoxidase
VHGCAHDLVGRFGQIELSPTEQQVVFLAVSVENGCEYCVAAHSFMARRMVKVPSPIVDALRAGDSLPDEKLNALAEFTRRVVRERGWVPEAAVMALLEHGFTRAKVLDVLAGVAAKTLSNYANHIMNTPLDAPLAAEAWQRKAGRGALVAPAPARTWALSLLQLRIRL